MGWKLIGAVIFRELCDLDDTFASSFLQPITFVNLCGAGTLDTAG